MLRERWVRSRGAFTALYNIIYLLPNLIFFPLRLSCAFRFMIEIINYS